ncbi:type II secretion system F family protein [Candidatus Saccharibacteria bacterium]|nr:type II secretion system F family protein [Candidatus Saccharibacteria bacterium]
MKKFTYEARDSATNKIIKSDIQAESEHSAAKLLNEQGYIPLKIEADDESSNPIKQLANRITTKDRIVFMRQLATLIGAGLPLAQSMRTVVEQTQNKRMKAVVEDIIVDIEGGQQLSVAFSKHPDAFDQVVIALVSAGEVSGTLDDALKRIAAQQEKDAAVMRKIRGALVYPLIVLAVIALVIVYMLIAVVPQVEQLYEDLGQNLPLLTQIMVNAANFLMTFWWVVVLVIVIGGYFFLQWTKTESGIRSLDAFKLNVPMFKNMFRKLYMSRFTRTGQTLLSTGVAMLDMLHITARSVNNTYVSASIERAAEKVKGGKALSSALKPEDYILPMVPQMIKIGEQSGKIDDMMGKTAQIYEDELDEEIKAISTAIEPILMVVLAVVAGGMVGAILFPIYSLVDTIGA